jgi:tRNA(Arg) A34 adenosine deaminase TadA
MRRTLRRVLDDLHWLRQAFRVAESSVEHGDYAFGAVLVDADGTLLLTSEQQLVRTGNWLGHAELVLLETAAQRWTREHLASATIYSSTEPCPMCTGAIGWSLRRLVFGLSQARMYGWWNTEGLPPPRFVEPWNCRVLLGHVHPAMEVVGPLLEDEAAVAHERWMRLHPAGS